MPNRPFRFEFKRFARLIGFLLVLILNYLYFAIENDNGGYANMTVVCDWHGN